MSRAEQSGKACNFVYTSDALQYQSSPNRVLVQRMRRANHASELITDTVQQSCNMWNRIPFEFYITLARLLMPSTRKS